MKQASSLLVLLITISFVGLLVYIWRMAAEGSSWGLILFGMFGPIAAYCLCSSLLFFGLYPLGILNKYVTKQVAGPESPFANERLPTQIIAPMDQGEAK